jgi:hypothetical protein
MATEYCLDLGSCDPKMARLRNALLSGQYLAGANPYTNLAARQASIVTSVALKAKLCPTKLGLGPKTSFPWKRFHFQICRYESQYRRQ